MADRPIRGPRGEHVYLRVIEPEDADLVHAWYADEAFRTTMGSSLMSLARRRRRFEAVAEDPSDELIKFVICRIEDDLAVGVIDLFAIDRTNGSCGFGIGIGDPALRGRGLGTDAVAALTDFAFGELRVERVWLATDARNVHAQAVYRKAGFVEEGRARHEWFIDGAFVDGVHMALLRDGWLALPRRRNWELIREASGREQGPDDRSE